MKSIFIAFFMCLSAAAFSQNLTDNTCKRYFEITAQLIKGGSISTAEWHLFLQDEAIQIYFKASFAIIL